jgi:L-fuconolactonase
MFGSDWPVLELAGKYGTWIDIVRRWVSNLTIGEQEQVMQKTALRAYRI